MVSEATHCYTSRLRITVQTRPSSEAFLRLAALLVVTFAITMIFEIFVVQTPYSPLQLALPIAPFVQLRETAITLSLFALALAALAPRLAPEGGGEPWGLFGLYSVGAVGTVCTLAVAAALGMNAVQVIDPRPGSSAIFAVRALFGLCLLVSALVALRRVFRRNP